MTKPQQDSCDDGGFTLVEVLVALVLLALMASLLAGAFGGLRQSQRLQDRIALQASVEPVETYMRHALTGMRPIRVAPGPTSAPMLAVASSDKLIFVTGYAPAGSYGGLQHVTWQVVESATAGVYDLEEMRGLRRTASALADGLQRTALLRGVARVAFRYADRRGAAGPAWTETWTASTLPKLIAVEVTFAAGDARVWLPLTVAIPTGSSLD